MSYRFQFGPVWDALPDLASGAAVTLSIAVVAMGAAIFVAAPIAVASTRRRGVSSLLARAWIEFARNTPCLLQVYVFYYGLGAFQIFLPAWLSVTIAIFFNSVGYLAEIYRGGLKGISRTQFKGGLSLGFNSFDVYRYIIFPQVFARTYNSITNQFIWALLNTSLGALIGLYDLSGMAIDYQSKTYRTFEFFLAIGVVYFLLAKGVLVLARQLPIARRR